MKNEEFIIEFNYNGWDYAGRVAINDGSVIVRYSVDHSPEMEQLIEIHRVVWTGENPLGWEEVTDNLHLKKTNQGLINAIAYALEIRYF